jgi:hypothetical protein
MEMDINQGTNAGQGSSMGDIGGTSQTEGDQPNQQQFGQGAGTSGGTFEQTKEQARQAATEAQQKITEQIRTRAESTKSQAADTLTSVANALSQSGQQLKADNPNVPSQYIERAGEQLRRAAENIRNTNVDELVRRTESMARRQPALFLGGAFVLGVVAARLIKSGQSASSYSNQYDSPRTSVVPQHAGWTGDRETPVSGYREPRNYTSGTGAATDAAFMDEFSRNDR